MPRSSCTTRARPDLVNGRTTTSCSMTARVCRIDTSPWARSTSSNEARSASPRRHPVVARKYHAAWCSWSRVTSRKRERVALSQVRISFGLAARALGGCGSGRHVPAQATPGDCLPQSPPEDGVDVAHAPRGETARPAIAPTVLEQIGIEAVEHAGVEANKREVADPWHDVEPEVAVVRRPRRGLDRHTNGRQPVLDEELRQGVLGGRRNHAATSSDTQLIKCSLCVGPRSEASTSHLAPPAARRWKVDNERPRPVRLPSRTACCAMAPLITGRIRPPYRPVEAAEEGTTERAGDAVPTLLGVRRPG